MTAQQLKNSILQLAIQGKLVPQDPNDEPASVLLERIRQEKENLVKQGKIKRDKNPSVIFRGADNITYEKTGLVTRAIDDELPFEIPENWEWARLGNIADLFTGTSINETEKQQLYTGRKEGYCYIGTKDVGFDNVITYENGVKIPTCIDKFRIAPADSVLMCVEGGSAGRKISVTDRDVCFGNKLCCFVPFRFSNLYLYFYLQSSAFSEMFKANTTGIIGGVSIKKLNCILLPIPPLAEQHRIVSKLETLLPLVESYGKRQVELDDLNATFPEALKKSILQEAIQGRLVEQDPNDEPASVLLERIREEKERL
ncbi:MAG: restriction endonuclease subunit S, partial [Thermoguttaceae bacterium]|nr:restriction endonuclease subunit S [Thermoguttaceae bacterium]